MGATHDIKIEKIITTIKYLVLAIYDILSYVLHTNMRLNNTLQNILKTIGCFRSLMLVVEKFAQSFFEILFSPKAARYFRTII